MKMTKFIELREKSDAIPVIGKPMEYHVFYLNADDIVSLRRTKGNEFTEIMTRQGLRYNVVEKVEWILDNIE